MVARRATAVQKATRETIANSKMMQRHINKVWNEGVNAPMFRKEYQAMEKDGKPRVKDGKPVMIRRSARLVSGHAYNIAVAGAVKEAVSRMKVECDRMGIDFPQSTRHPFMLGLPKGTKLMMDQFLAAVVASAMLHATRMMNESGKHKRLNKGYVKRAFFEVVKRLNVASAAPQATLVVPLKKKNSKKTGGDDEYEPPADGDADAAEDEAEDEAAADGAASDDDQ